MKRYNQTKLSKRIDLFALLATTGLKWSDSSYKNDICDSVVAELPDGGDFQLWLPNTDEITDYDSEQFNEFTLVRHDENDENINEQLMGTIEDAITTIKALYASITKEDEARAMKRQTERYSARIEQLDNLNNELLEALKSLTDSQKGLNFQQWKEATAKALQAITKAKP